MSELWLSNKKMTVWVKTDNQSLILDTSPIVKKFIGQSLYNLIGWMEKQGSFLMRRLKESDKEK